MSLALDAGLVLIGGVVAVFVAAGLVRLLAKRRHHKKRARTITLTGAAA